MQAAVFQGQSLKRPHLDNSEPGRWKWPLILSAYKKENVLFLILTVYKKGKMLLLILSAYKKGVFLGSMAATFTGLTVLQDVRKLENNTFYSN